MEAERLAREQRQLYLLLSQLLELQSQVAHELTRFAASPLAGMAAYQRPQVRFATDALQGVMVNHVLEADAEELRSLVELVSHLSSINGNLVPPPNEPPDVPAASDLLRATPARIAQVQLWVQPRLERPMTVLRRPWWRRLLRG
jgi:hypothetical protein